MRPAERLEELGKMIQELIHLNREIPVVVEGKKDERALRALGVAGEIVRLNKGISVFRTCEDLSRKHKKVVLLTDWDRRGGQLSRLLKDGLDANSVHYEESIRAKIAWLCKKDIKDVQSLPKHIARLEELARGQNRRT